MTGLNTAGGTGSGGLDLEASEELLGVDQGVGAHVARLDHVELVSAADQHLHGDRVVALEAEVVCADACLEGKIRCPPRQLQPSWYREASSSAVAGELG